MLNCSNNIATDIDMCHLICIILAVSTQDDDKDENEDGDGDGEVKEKNIGEGCYVLRFVPSPKTN